MDKIVDKINQFGSLSKELIDLLESSEILVSLDDSSFDLDIYDKDCLLPLTSSKKGIYYFTVLFPPSKFSTPDNFGEHWGCKGNKNEKITETPVYYKGRGKHHNNTWGHNQYIPFYLGKSEDIQKRVTEHMFDDSTSQTYSMKFKERRGFLKGFKFKLAYIYLDDDSYFSVEVIEKYLRNKLNPIIGKQ